MYSIFYLINLLNSFFDNIFYKLNILSIYIIIHNNYGNIKHNNIMTSRIIIINELLFIVTMTTSNIMI